MLPLIGSFVLAYPIGSFVLAYRSGGPIIDLLLSELSSVAVSLISLPHCLSTFFLFSWSNRGILLFFFFVLFYI